MTMKNQTQSDRLRSVLKEQQISVLGFAIRIGIAPPHQLYSILKGEEEMSAEIAERKQTAAAVFGAVAVERKG